MDESGSSTRKPKPRKDSMQGTSSSRHRDPYDDVFEMDVGDLESALLPDAEEDDAAWQEEEIEEDDVVEERTGTTNDRIDIIRPDSGSSFSTSWPMLRRSSLTVRRMPPHWIPATEEAQAGTPVASVLLQSLSSSFAPSSFLTQEVKNSLVYGEKQESKATEGGAVLSEVLPQRHGTSERKGDSTMLRSKETYEICKSPWNSFRTALVTPLSMIDIWSITIGIINAVIAVPVMASFTAIIFDEDVFTPVLSSLGKLVILASALHQVIFTTRSSMKYAVGQVQDVGIIFLSAIASGIVEDCTTAGLDSRDTISTTLVGLSLVTLLCGIAIAITGSLRLASLVQFCPLPVVGGYLAYVGIFCFLAGMSQAVGVGHISTLVSLKKLFNMSAMLHLAPCLCLTLCLSIIQNRARSPLALPFLLVATPLMFYFVLYLGGWSILDAQENGWLARPQHTSGQWKPWHVWKLYNIDSWPPKNIFWPAFPRQAGKVLGLFVAVAFGSSMDIAAVQTEAPEELDYNRELVMVGQSNILAGFLGVGLTGSYIFSQTLFSLRQGVKTFWMGAVVVLIEAGVATSPTDLMSIIPRFYFGGLLCYIGFDILKDWLVISFKKISGVEYGLLIFTFLAVAYYGLEIGIIAGIFGASMLFSVAYSSTTVKAVSVVPSRSGSVRPYHERMVLELFSARIVAVLLNGFLYFGSAAKLADQTIRIVENVLLPQPLKLGMTEEIEQTEAFSNGLAKRANFRASETASGTKYYKKNCNSMSRDSSLYLSSYDRYAVDILSSVTANVSTEDVSTALSEAPLICLLDMSRVLGMDATAARALLTLQNRLYRRGVTFALTGLRDDDSGKKLRRVLVGQGVILKQSATRQDDVTVDERSNIFALEENLPPGKAQISNRNSANMSNYEEFSHEAIIEVSQHIDWFPSMDAGMSHFEEVFLSIGQKHRLCPPPIERVSLLETLRLNLSVPPLDFGKHHPDLEAAARYLVNHCVRQVVHSGQFMWRLGDASDEFFILESAVISCFIDPAMNSAHSRAVEAGLPNDLKGSPFHSRSLRYGPGTIVGDLDFVLGRPRSITAKCIRSGSAFRLDRSNFASFASEAPQVYAILQAMMLRINCLSASHAFDVHDRSRM